MKSGAPEWMRRIFVLLLKTKNFILFDEKTSRKFAYMRFLL